MDRITQKVRFPLDAEKKEYVEIDVDISRDAISKLTNRLIDDEDFRAQFNKNPEKIFNDIGISLDASTIEKIRNSPVKGMLNELAPDQSSRGAPVVVIVAVIILATPSPAY